MSMQFVIGTAVENQTQKLVELSEEWLNQSKDHEVFYLVPNHVKFQTEIHVLKELSNRPSFSDWKNMASMRLQVFSFSRLAWYYLQNTEAYQKQALSQSGKYMLLKKVLLELSDELSLFQYDITQPGFVEQLVDLFDEMQEGLIMPNDLAFNLSNTEKNNNSEEEMVKLKDIQLIYQAYINQLALIDANSHELILSLVNFLASKKMENVLFIVSGFSNFTASERSLIDVLMQISGEFKIGLVLDKSYTHQLPETTDLFFNTGKLYYELYHAAKKNKVKLLFDIKLVMETSMSPIDRVWQSSQKALSPKQRITEKVQEDTLRIWKCQDVYSEMVSVSKEIRRLVTEERYRYRDMIVLTRDLEAYEKILAPVLNANEIPFYFNHEEKMTYHPLVEFITALFNMKDYFFQYKDVLRFLRTELFFPTVNEYKTLNDWERGLKHFRQKIDYTENVVLQYGYKGIDWVKEKDWQYITFDESLDNDQAKRIEAQSNEVRRLIKANVAPFFDALNQVKTCKEASFLLYQFMIEAGVEKQLGFLRHQAIERGDLIQAKNQEQTWQTFISLLDEYTELMGELPFNLDDFIQIFKSGFEGAVYSKVPATLDQVEVTSMDLVQAKKSKVTFIIGATDAKMPQKIENKTILTDEERILLKRHLPEDKYIKMDVISDYAREPFVFYLALLSAQDKVIISYPIESETSKELKESPYLSLLKKGLGIEEITQTKGFTLENYLDVNRFSTDEMLLNEWIAFKRDLTDESLKVPWLFRQLEKRLLKKIPLKTELLLSSLTYKNIPDSLTAESVEAIYGQSIYASVSKIETFNKCHYKYFLMYGIGLKDRDTYEMSSAITGDLYHDALDRFYKELLKNNLTLSTMTESDIKLITDNLLKSVFGEAKYGILETNNRMNYIKYQLSKTIERAIWSLKKQSQRSSMNVVQTEVLFGQILQEKGLDSLNFKLSNDRQIKVRGKIDRVDQMMVKDEMYLAIVDYKSSRHQFDFVDAYYGIAMQMVTYLDVALNNAVSLVGQKAKMAGAFYMHVQNPVISTNEALNQETISDELLKQFQYEGLLADNQDVLEVLDKTIEPGTKSLVYPYQQLKKETMKSSQFVTEEETFFLIEKNQENFKQAGEAIFNGDTQLNPAYKKQKRIACEYCPFRSVCQFDVMLKENNYHKIEPLTKEDMMKKWKEGKANDID